MFLWYYRDIWWLMCLFTDMHRLFLVFDVLREVSYYQETNDLAAVVGVSRAWYGAAIPLLWRKVDFSVLKMFGKMLESETRWKFVVRTFRSLD